MSDLAPSSPFQSLPAPALPSAVPSTSAASGPALHKAAQQFEAIFLRQILAEAHKSSMGDTLFSSDADQTFQQMQDAQFADIAASRDALGMAGMIERQLGARAASAAATTATTKGGGA